jgi:hypothetical protein
VCVCRLARDEISFAILARYCALRWFLSTTAMCREPLCPKPGVTCSWHDVYASCQKALPFLHRSYGLMRQTKTLLLPSALAWSAGLCRLSQAPAGRWPFPTLSLQSLRRCLDPYPAVSFQCICPLLPGRQRPHLKRHRFGTPKYPLQCNFNRALLFGAAVRQAHRPEHSRRAVIPLCSGSHAR